MPENTMTDGYLDVSWASPGIIGISGRYKWMS